MTEPEYWTTTQVADHLGVLVGTVSSYRQRGQMPPPDKTHGRTHLWAADTIIKWRRGDTSKTKSSMAERLTSGQWVTGEESLIYDNQWVQLSLVDVQPPHGQAFRHHVVTMREAAVCLIEDRGRVALMYRHRFAPDLWNWELPGGLVDADEEPREAVAREIREELGLSVSELDLVLSYEPNVGMVRNRHHVFRGSGITSREEPTELNEMTRLEWFTKAQVRELVDSGQIMNSGTLIAVLHWLAYS